MMSELAYASSINLSGWITEWQHNEQSALGQPSTATRTLNCVFAWRFTFRFAAEMMMPIAVAAGGACVCAGWSNGGRIDAGAPSCHCECSHIEHMRHRDNKVFKWFYWIWMNLVISRRVAHRLLTSGSPKWGWFSSKWFMFCWTRWLDGLVRR